MDIFEDLDFIDDLFLAENIGHELQIPRIMPDRENPLEIYSDKEIKIRFRFSPDVIKKVILPLVLNPLSKETDRGCPLPPLYKLLIALRFYATGEFQIVAGDLFHVSQSTVSNVVRRVSDVLSENLRRYICFPDNLEDVKLNFHKIAAFPGIIGCVDGTHIPIQCPQLERGEIFRNRKGRFSINVQVVGGPDLKIYDLVARWPGSAHDSRIFQNSRVKNRLETGLLKGILLGDSGYPQSPYLYTPALEPVLPQRPNRNTINYNMDLQNYRNELRHYYCQTRYNRAHKSTRNSVERLFGVWKRKFPCIFKPLAYKLDTILLIITATAILHNISIETKDVIHFDNIDFNDDHPELDPVPLNIRGSRLRDIFMDRYFSIERR